MTGKQHYWIRDVDGAYALVHGAAARDEWTTVHGWQNAGEPGPTDQVHVVHEHPDVLPGRLPYAAVAMLAGLGWSAGAPGGVVVQDEPAESVRPSKGKNPAVADGEPTKE